MALVSLVDDDRQFFKSCLGLPQPWAAQRQTPLSHSFCQHVVESGRPLVISDAREHPVLRDNPAIRDLGIIAYAGVPLIAPTGDVLGTLCAIDHQPRHWTTEQVEILSPISPDRSSAKSSSTPASRTRASGAAEPVALGQDRPSRRFQDVALVPGARGRAIARSSEAR